MTMENRIATLKSRHAEIERRIGEELSRPQPNEVLVADLKRDKLRIKDELQHHARSS